MKTILSGLENSEVVKYLAEIAAKRAELVNDTPLMILVNLRTQNQRKELIQRKFEITR